MCTNCNKNNCNECTQEVHICNQCTSEVATCGCEIIDFKSDCIIYNADDIECNSVVVVAKNTILSDALNQIVSWSCTKFSELANYLRIVNVGTGASIYAGDNLIGEKKLRKLKSTNGSVTITQGTDDIDFSVTVNDGSETKVTAGTNVSITGTGTIATPYVVNSTDTNSTYSVSNIGTGANIYKDSTVAGVNTQFNVRKIKSSDNSVIITEGTSDIDITVLGSVIPDGSETKLTAGSNISITGIGTIATPYIINATDTNTTYSAGTGLVLTGTVFSTENLQKVITYPSDFSGTNYTLTNADNNYEIIVDNGTTAVTITVPGGLVSKIGVGFTQKGTADVSYTASGTTINSPIGLKIKGQYYQTYLSQELATNIFYLGGNTRI